MVLKIFRVVWFLSVLVLFASLLYSYAGWRDSLILQEGSTNESQITMQKDALFYVLVGLIAFINVLVYAIGKVYKNQEDFRAWFHGLIITINAFFMLAISLVAVYNSDDVFDFSRVGFMVYGSVTLIAVWAISWPLYLLFQKFFFKQAI